MSKILIVEDNEMNRDMLSRRLERKGFDVVMAEDGQKGVNMSKSDSPDLILMDLSLPVMDGWEATSTIKADDSTKNIPIIPTKLKNTIAIIAYCRLSVNARIRDITPGTSQAVDFPANA